jgi:MFS superfamily sulfate permease-like transporter
VGAINLLFCWVGGYPMCHGSGGLAGQHRFGARTNLSIIVLGCCKLLLGVFCGAGLLSLLRFFPNALLAALLAVASWELSVSGREGLQGSIEDARLCILTASFVTFWGQGTGIVLGLLVAYSLLMADACFGAPEDVKRGRQRLRDNAQLLGRMGRDVWKSWRGRGEGGGGGGGGGE